MKTPAASATVCQRPADLASGQTTALEHLSAARPVSVGSKALSLFLLCLAAKVAVLAGHTVAIGLWTPAAYLWQDALAALLLGLLELATRRKPWIIWFPYGAAVFYTAVNVPFTRILSSPFTWQMGPAARGALADSITHYLTPGNIFLMALFVAAGLWLPFLLARIAGKTTRITALAGFVLVVTGPLATKRIETLGLHRNALVGFVRSAFPRMGVRGADEDWRRSPFRKPALAGNPLPVAKHEASLSSLRGAAATRNVVMIHLESTGARYLHPFGAADDPMPNLTELAEQALVFENAYAVCPESIKGLFSIICSRYPAFDCPAERCAQIRTPALAEILAKADYRTALFHSGRFLYLGMNAVIRNRGYEVMEDSGAIGGNVHSSFGVDEPATIQRMLSWIDALPKGNKFFITYLPIAGHHPYDSPEPGPFAEASEVGRYRNALYYGDQALGVFVAELKRRGLDTNTLFVIFGDHGEAFGQHEGNYGHTFFIHEENLHVPLVVAAPGLICQPRRCSTVASLIDLAPTILDLVGLPAPPDYQGASLLKGEERMALFYTDYSLGFLGLRDGRWKFVYELESGRQSLFDLSMDQEEKQDLARRFTEQPLVYQQHLQRWSAAQRELLLRGR